MPQIDYIEVATGSSPLLKTIDYKNAKIYIITQFEDDGTGNPKNKDYVIKYTADNINYLSKKISVNDMEITIGIIENTSTVKSGRKYPDRTNPANTIEKYFVPAILDIPS